MAPGILLQDDVVMEDAASPNPESQDLPQAISITLPTVEAASDSSDKENQIGKKLEETFDDDDSEDEYMSSMPVFEPHTAKASDPDVMRAFYQRLLPFKFLFLWLNHSPIPTKDFANREFAFTLPNDAYLRYQSFATADLLRKQCVQLVPSRFEIGPIYSSNPRDRKTLRKASMFRPVSKELVFDIDMTDYDPIRTCCSGAKICKKCWQFITMAIKVVDVALRDDFGFKHVLWVYSGRRGAHAWVSDKRARELDDQRRRAIAGYLELLKGGDKGGKKVAAHRPLHPHLSRSLDILAPHFQTDVLQVQDPWETDEKSAELLHLLPDTTLNEALRKKWDSAPGRSSLNKWKDINAVAESGASKNLDTKALKEAKEDVILEYTYPRLDAEVSKKLNHLLKSPFCVHPGTGRVCVPIDVRKLEEFDPFSVPTVLDLLGEIDEWHREHPAHSQDEGEKKMADWEKTSLKPYVEYFRGFVNGLLRDEKPVKREADAMEF